MHQFVEQEMGPLRIMRLPEPGMVYTLGGDASTGLADDYTCFQILSNTIPFEQVAVFRAKWPVNKVSEFANQLGRFYNEALIVMEINYPGNSVQDALLDYYKYPRNYQAETRLDQDMDISDKYGFRTTESSKWLLINEMQLALSEGGIVLHDPVTISEMMNFVYMQSKGKAGAADGFNDDTVMALMMAYHGAKLYPFAKPRKKQVITHQTQDVDVQKAWKQFRKQLSSGRTQKGIVL